MIVPQLNTPAGVINANIRINFTSPETRGIVRPDAENRTIVWTQYRNVTNRQTDSQTESLYGYTALCIASNADAL